MYHISLLGHVYKLYIFQFTRKSFSRTFSHTRSLRPCNIFLLRRCSTLPEISDETRSSYVPNNTSYDTISFIDNFYKPVGRKQKALEILSTYPVRFKKYVEPCFEDNFDTVNGWKIIFDKIEKDPTVSEKTFETLLMKECLRKNNLKLANSLLDYLKTKNESINFIAKSVYLILLAENYNEIEDGLFEDTYKEILLKEPLIQEPRLIVICALTKAKLIDEALHHLTILQKNYNLINFLTKAINLVIQVLASEKGFDTAFNYLKLLEKESKPSAQGTPSSFLDKETILSLLQAIHKSDLDDKSKDNQYDLTLKAMRTFELKIDEHFIQVISTLFPSNWNVNKVIKITNREPCTSCGAELLPPSLDLATFNRLRTSVLQKVVKGRDIFWSTTPHEWKKFLNFINGNGPFDIVVDGLNLYYLERDNRRDFQPEKNFIQFSLDHSKCKILVLARVHIKSFLRERRSWLPNMYAFFLDTVTKDDVFVLYAAFHSGLHCKVVTRDYLRNHKFVLEDPVLQKQFLEWQRMNQILIGQENKKLVYRRPYLYRPVTQWNEEKHSWHIPLKTEEKKDYMDGANEWLCLQKKTPYIQHRTKK